MKFTCIACNRSFGALEHIAKHVISSTRCLRHYKEPEDESTIANIIDELGKLVIVSRTTMDESAEQNFQDNVDTLGGAINELLGFDLSEDSDDVSSDLSDPDGEIDQSETGLSKSETGDSDISDSSA